MLHDCLRTVCTRSTGHAQYRESSFDRTGSRLRLSIFMYGCCHHVKTLSQCGRRSVSIYKKLSSFPLSFVQNIVHSQWIREPNNRSEEHTTELQSRGNLVC